MNKHKFLIAIVSIAILFLYSCEKDMYGEATRKQIERNDFTINRKSFDQLNKEAKFNAAYKEINSEIQNRKLSSKTVMEEMYNFTIDSSQINEVITEKYTSYSFGIIRDSINPNFYENLFIEIDSTDAPQASILKFNINPNTKEIISISSKLIQYDISQVGKIYYTPPCDYVTVTTETQCSCFGHWPGQSCTCVQEGGTGPTSSTRTYLVCQDDAGGSEDTWTNTSSESGGGGSGGTSISAPRELTPKEQRVKNFKQQRLSLEQKDCLNNLDENTQGQIMDYLENEIVVDGLESSALEYPQESVDFAICSLNEICNGGNADFENSVLIDSSFVNKPKIKCVYNKLMNSSNSNNLFRTMISKFRGSTNKNLIFEVGTVPVGDWAITNGDTLTTNNYNIISNPTLETKSNLLVMNTLSHELIHAYMFDFLEDWGYISFAADGSPILNLNCDPTTVYSGLNLNTLTVQERFEALICAMYQNSTLTEQWSHDLFSTWIFDINDYRTQLELLLLNEHDWDGETTVFKNNAISVFGVTDWKQEVAKAVSWIGLEYTDGYNNYLNSYSSNITKFLFIQDIKNKLNNAKSNCP